MGEFFNNNIIPLFGVGKTAVAAIFDGFSVLACYHGEVPAAILSWVEGAEAEKTVYLLHVMTGVVFTICVLKVTGVHGRPPLKMQKAATLSRTAAALSAVMPRQ